MLNSLFKLKRKRLAVQMRTSASTICIEYLSTRLLHLQGIVSRQTADH